MNKITIIGTGSVGSTIAYTLTVSSMLHGEYGISDVCLSLLNVVNSKGTDGKLILPLNDEEIAALHNSADTLKNLIAGLRI